MKNFPFHSPIDSIWRRATLCFCTYPFACLLFLLSYFAYGFLFSALFTLAAGLIAFLLVGITVGTLLFMTGTLYGIHLLFTASSAAPGLYEIGLGLTVGGISLLFSLFSWLFLRRFFPFLLDKIRWLFLTCYNRPMALFASVRKAVGVK